MDKCMKELRESDYGVQMGKSNIKCLVYSDDQVILAPSEGELQKMLDIMNESFRKRGMKINAEKTKVMIFERNENVTVCNIKIQGMIIDQVNEFVYLGSVFTRDGKFDEDIERRVRKGNAVNGAISGVMGSNILSQKAYMSIHNALLVPTLTFGSESWVWQKKDESRINAVEMRYLRKICGIKQPPPNANDPRATLSRHFRDDLPEVDEDDWEGA
ncbi:uncharacterized protein LOC113228612 [Hyposmocoma kahamanoa]|uniref:uncharacterized protein LOC113228612 n=1 Tax=Hyposmocoma kahamanoa TaxID=1477025 RepID=UPI000E6D7C63|nr:uncharacterized protein LOC113228612 [Hyposmocoma kahamanoa]